MNKLIFLPLLFFSNTSFAASGVNQVAAFGALGQLVLAIGYMVGLYMFIYGLYSFYLTGKYGNDPSRSIASSFWQVATGIMLLLSSTVYAIAKGTISPTWTNTNQVLALSSSAFNNVSATGFLGYIPEGTLKTLLSAIWLIGLIGFLKGIYLFRFAADQASGSQGYSPVKKIITHILGGVLLMNIKDTSTAVGTFFGWDFLII